ncbi:MAG: DNA polymerase III subunit gamma/tau [Lachnospiraceae bacterium]
MSYTALYRKWRPASFQDVKGQDHIVQTLKNQITAERIGHAYLFCGTRGTGKTSIAKIFAKAVNCEHPVDGSPCNQCKTCQNIASGASLNVVEIDAASNNGVENIREIRDQVQYPPTEGTYRVYIIDEVHMLSTGAFNALLKTLEEPPSYVIFILATTEVHKIPITVLSRCQRYDFKRITIQTLVDRLKELTDAEKIQVEDKALAYIAKAADGSMRDALSLLDQCVAFHYGELLTYDSVLEVLGAVDTGVFANMFRAVTQNRTLDCIRSLEEMVIQGRELGQFVVDFIWYLRNLLLIQTAEDAENMLDISTENLAAMKEDAELVKPEELMRYIRIFSELSNQLRYATQKRVLIELALIKLTTPSMEHNLDSIIQRLNQIEDRLEEGIPMDPELMNRMAAAVPTASGPAAGAAAPAVSEKEPERVTIPKAQLEDLNLIRNEWGKIVREMGGAIRSSFRDTVIEPSGDSCLCIVFSSVETYAIGSRPTTIGEIERYVEQTYGKSIYFKTRQRGSGERLNTIYVSDEELRANIHMDIEIEE